MPIRRLRELIESGLAALPPGALLAAYSGGLDSTVLLHLLSQSDDARARGLRAVHVDHGLHADSARWSEHCRKAAETLGVELVMRQVQVERTSGLGLEASARRARYAAIESLLAPREIVALAHHRGDQAETVLLKLLRGAGPEGLGAMRALRPFGDGQAWRPLLSVPRSALREYASHHRLDWIDDPSNQDPSLDRNHVRLAVLPQIAPRWPEAEASLAQSAAWARDAADFIDGEAERALARMQGLDPATLRHRDWLALPRALRDPVLRRWLRSLGLPEPTQHQSAEIARQLVESSADSQPCVRWRGAEVRRYRDLLHALAPLSPLPQDWSSPFDGRDLELPGGLGRLRLLGDDGAPVQLHVPLVAHFRRGGEGLRFVAGGPTRELRDLFQEAGVPPWQRDRLPMLSEPDERGGGLLAVGDLWLGQAGAALFAAARTRLEWTRDQAAC